MKIIYLFNFYHFNTQKQEESFKNLKEGFCLN